MAADERHPVGDGTCPNCGAEVVYRGVGRRPVWCSTRCRNDASLKRLGARRAAMEIRVVEIPRERVSGAKSGSGRVAESLADESGGDPTNGAKPPPHTAEQALRILRNDPVAVGKLLSHLERRRVDGTLAEPQWLAVRNALRLIAGELGCAMERPGTPG